MNGDAIAVRKHVQTLGLAFTMFTPKAWIITALAAAIGLVVIGLPTAIYENPFFVRMTPVRAQDYVIWVVSSALIGFIVGSYFVGGSKAREGKILSGSVWEREFASWSQKCRCRILLPWRGSGHSFQFCALASRAVQLDS